jgi:hypothetical protein
VLGLKTYSIAPPEVGPANGSEIAITAPAAMFTKAAGQHAPLVGMDKPMEPEHANQHDRRRRVRTKLRWLVLIRARDGEAVESVTENLSSQGFYFFSSRPFVCGDMLRCWMTIPTYDPTGISGRVAMECEVQVVRSEVGPDKGLFGIACQMKDYHLAWTGNGSLSLPSHPKH